MSLRIVSLLPSATEIVCALGLRDALVGVSHECDWPADVVGLPVVTSTRARHHTDSSAIDRDVRTILRDALAVYDIDTEELARLAPDVIVTQDLCDVCAVSFEDVCRAARELANPDCKIVNTHPTTLPEIFDDIDKVAAATGRDAEAQQLRGQMTRRIDEVRQRAAELPRRGVLAVEWLDPIMIGGMWTPELIEHAGGLPVAAQRGEHAPTLQPAELAALRPAPEVVLVKPCGFDIERTMQEESTVRRILDTLSDSGEPPRAYVADGNAFFNRPGPRIVDSLEILAACVHPEQFADLAQQHAGSYREL